MADPFIIARRIALSSLPGEIYLNNGSAEQDAIMAVPNKRLFVYRYRIMVPSACVIEVYNGPVADNDRIDVLEFGAAGGISEPLSELPYWETSAGKALVFKPSVSVRITGACRYRAD